MTLARLDITGPVATITINRPEQRNALSIALLSDLHRRLDDLHGMLSPPIEQPASDAPRVLVLTGAGKSFCAGMDLKEVLADPANPLQLLSALADLCLKLRALPCPTIAMVNGAAIGGGCGLATVCDFAITHADAKLGFPEVDLGVCPAVVAPWLARKVGHGRARAILLRGGVMTGQAAAAVGIVDHAVPLIDDLASAVQTLADRLAQAGPRAIAATKGLLNELEGSLDRQMATRAAELSALVLADPHTQGTLRAKIFHERPEGNLAPEHAATVTRTNPNS